MSITSEQRIQAESIATEIQLFLYAEPESGEKLWAIAQNFNLTERSVYKQFAQLVGDVILGFYKPADIPALLRFSIPGLDETKINGVTGELYNFLAPLNFPQQPPISPLQTEISAAEKDLAALETVRTMPHDMAAIKPGSDVVYQSSQADILARNLNDGVSIADTPVSTQPRWDSDTRRQ